MTKINKKQIINGILMEYLKKKVGTTVNGLEILWTVRNHVDFQVYDDTILRYMRELRDNSMIGYECSCKMQSKYWINYVYSPEN